MYRLFVAITPPHSVRTKVELLRYGIPGASWVEQKNMHLTLRFVGEVDGADFADLAEALAEIEAKRFSITLKGVGHFPPRSEPNQLWVGVEPSDELLRLQKRIERVVRDIGLPAEKRKYSPHITIARLNGSPANRIAEFLTQAALTRFEPFEATEFRLYSSELGGEGAVHRIESSYELLE